MKVNQDKYNDALYELLLDYLEDDLKEIFEIWDSSSIEEQKILQKRLLENIEKIVKIVLLEAEPVTIKVLEYISNKYK